MKQPRLPVQVNPFRLVEQQRTLQGEISLNELPRLDGLLFTDSIAGPGQQIAQSQDSQLSAKASKAAQADDVATSKNTVTVNLVFARSESGLPMVTGHIRGVLQLQCQRCLEPVDFNLNSELAVVFVSSDFQADKLKEGYDTWLIEDELLYINDFIEDEILLALPIVVMHENCEPVFKLAGPEAEPQGKQNDFNGTQDNPFAVLKDLKLKN